MGIIHDLKVSSKINFCSVSEFAHYADKKG